MRVCGKGAGEGVVEEGFVVGAERLGLGPFGGAGGAAGRVGCVGALVADMARQGGEARCPAHEVVEGPGFHIFGLWSACVPFLEMKRAARA